MKTNANKLKKIDIWHISVKQSFHCVSITDSKGELLRKLKVTITDSKGELPRELKVTFTFGLSDSILDRHSHLPSLF